MTRFVVKDIPPTKALPEYKWAVLDTKRVRYVLYCTSEADAIRAADERNAGKPRVARRR